MPLWHQGNIKSAGNPPFLIQSVTGIVLPSRIWDVLLVAFFVAIFILVFLLGRANRDATLPGRLRIIVVATAALTLALLLFSKKSWPAYLMLSLFPICLLIDVRVFSRFSSCSWEGTAGCSRPPSNGSLAPPRRPCRQTPPSPFWLSAGSSGNRPGGVISRSAIP